MRNFIFRKLQILLTHFSTTFLVVTRSNTGKSSPYNFGQERSGYRGFDVCSGQVGCNGFNGHE